MKKVLRQCAALALSICVSFTTTLPAHASGEPASQANLPFDPLPYSQLVTKGKKVFAHYFTPFPVSLDNKSATSDYYATQYLNPYGEKSKFLDRGGYLRARPLARAVSGSSSWQLDDMRKEIRMAKAIGLDGFAVDILNYEGTHWERTLRLLEAARLEGGGFKIMLMPDMNAGLRKNPGQFVPMMKKLASHAAALRVDGKLVVAPYHASKQTAQWWKNQLATLRNSGINVALVPVFQGWQSYISAYSSFSYGISDWGHRNISDASKTLWTKAPRIAQAAGLRWMAPVAPQDIRPKTSNYWEAGNSLMYRQQWEAAINGGADWVQLITWNDYSEHSGIAPNSATGHGFYDMTAYYVHWFKTGARPAIKRDVVYGFNRTHGTAAPRNTTLQRLPMQPASGSAAPRNQVEMHAFLTAPGTLEIELGGTVHRKSVGAGPQVFTAPLKAGTPTYRIVRNGTVVASVKGKPILSSVKVQDMQYHSVSSKR